MAVLDLYKRRPPHTIYIEVEKKKVAFNIPTQFTVEEVERILEVQDQIDQLKKERVEIGSEEASRAIELFWENVYMQLLTLFNHYHPEVDLDYLKKYVSQENALEIIAFHTAEHVRNVKEDAKNLKKKPTVKN